MALVETRRVPVKPPAKDIEPGTLKPGTVLQNRYEIIKMLAVGGMGSVYQARDLRFPSVTRLCAVKEMINTAPDPRLREMTIRNFEREANILATLSHPAVPKIFDYFTEGTRSYLVLEYIDGQDLEAYLESHEGFIPEDQVIDWAIQICDVLEYLHNHKPQPIVFRDMKPSNIMLDKHNRIVLIDFGIAKVFQAGQKGTMIGTEGYSPPEQYRGVAEPRGDIYALGATLHHLLTRRDPRLEPPFSFHERPIRAINPSVSEALEAVIMKALEYDVEKRFSSAAEMKAALEAVRARRQQAQRPGAGPPSLGTLAFTTPSEGIVPIWEFTCEDEVRSTPAIAGGVVYIGSYDNNLYALDAKSGKFLWKYPTDAGICSTPCVWRDKVIVGSEDRVMYAVNARTGRIVWTCPTRDRIRSSPRVAYEHAFFGSDDGRLYTVNAETGRVVWTFETMAPIRSSPAVVDEVVYFGSNDGYVYAVNIKGGTVKWKFHSGRSIISSPTVEEGMLYVGSTDWNLYALAARSGFQVWRYRTGSYVISSPTVAGGLVYFGSVDGHVYALDAQSGRLVWKYATEGQVTSSPVVVNGVLYVGSVDHHVYSLDAKTGELRWRFPTGGPVPGSPRVTDGVVYIGSTDHKVYALPA